MTGEHSLPPHRRFADTRSSHPVRSGDRFSHHPDPHNQLNSSRQDSTIDDTTASNRIHQGAFTESAKGIQSRQISNTQSQQIKGNQPQQISDSSLEHSNKTSLHQINSTSPQQTNGTSLQRVDSANAVQGHNAQAHSATKTRLEQKTSGTQGANGTQVVKMNVQYSSQDARNTIADPVMTRPTPPNRNHGGPNQATQKKKAPQKKQAAGKKSAVEKQAAVEKKQAAEKKLSPWIRDRDLKGDHLLPDGWFKQDQPDLNAGDVGNLFWAWEGQHMPPPIWDERPGFKDTDRDGTIDSWLNKIVEDKNPLGSAVIPLPSSTNFSFIVNNPLVPNGRLFFAPAQKDALMGHIVPLSWIPDTLEPGQSLQNFWEQNINADPKHVDEEDTIDQKPFWETFVSPNVAIQLPRQHPEHNGCDTSEDTPEDTQKLRQENGSKGWIDQYFANPGKFMRTCIGIKSLHKRDISPSPEPAPAIYTPVSFIDDTIRPSINLFVRSARPSDVPQMTEIYNHYVMNSVCTPEYKAILDSDMAERFNSARTNEFPFIVACVRGKSKNPGKRRNRHNNTPNLDTVVGFAFADDYHDQRNAMRFTAELCVFASPTYKRKGISKCLMDKMMQLLDTYYTPRGCFDILDDKLGLGEVRVISRMVINLLYCPDDGEKEWITPHLAEFGFGQAGHLDGVGYKLEKLVDLAVFYRKTGIEINVKRPPLVPL